MSAAPRLALSVFATFAVGGQQVRFASVANRLGRSLRHAVIAMDGNLACRERLDPGLDLMFPAVALRRGDWLGNLRRIRAALRGLRPDVLLTHSWGSIEWALANAPPGVPALVRHVHVEDGFGPEERDRQLPRRVWMRRLALRRATVALPSRTLLRIAHDIWRLPRERVLYVPNGVDLSRFARAGKPAAAPWALAGAGPVAGTVAALRPEKNLPRLLRALALAPALRLVVVGDGPERAALESLACTLGIAERVIFTGHLADPAAAYRHFDLFALSSDTEQMPLSVLEAMAAGLPVVATDVGDVAQMLAAENAPLVVPRDHAALGAALVRLGADAALRRRLGGANRAKAAQDYDEAQMFTAWARLLGVAPDAD